MKYKTMIKAISNVTGAISWQRVLEVPRLAKSLLRKGILLVLDRVTKESCISLHLFLSSVYRMGRKSGWLFTALYLKQCMSSLKIAYGGEYDSSLSLSVAVSLTRRGYPRIIPRFSRIQMYKKDERADRVVKMYLCFLSLFTIIERGKVIKASLFDTIRSPIQDIDQVVAQVGLIKSNLVPILERYVPKIRTIPLHQGMVWKPSWKVLPSYASLPYLYKIFPDLLRVKSPFVNQTMEMAAFSHLSQFVAKEGEQWIQGILFPHRTRFCFDEQNKHFSGTDLDEYESKVGPFLPPWHPAMGPVMTGRLAQTVQGGGKRRIFAIGNWVNQRLLTPVHQWLASVLRCLPTDGTFDQAAPLTRLRGSSISYCFDLTAATDRWPLVFMFETLGVLFDRSFASAVVNSALACNIFHISFLKRNDTSRPKAWISFVAGQPLGYRSSWPLFALTHHILVWWCAEQVYPGTVFQKYALLGDDIVITDERVADEYLAVLKVLQVKVSMGKTLISKTGAAEFAKRFVVRNFSVDLSSITVKALLSIHIPICRFSLSYRYPILRLSTFRRLGGAGYKSCGAQKGRKSENKSKRFIEDWNLWSLLNSPSLEFYFGDGRPLDRARFWWLFRKGVSMFAPKELKIPPANLFVSEEQATFSEYTSFRNHMSSWISYYSWWLGMFKILTGLDYSCHPDKQILDQASINDVFDAPLVDIDYAVKRVDPARIRHSRLIRLKAELDALPEIVYLNYSSKDISSDLNSGVHLSWCPCESSDDEMVGCGDGFLVKMKGLIIPPSARCVSCFKRRIFSSPKSRL